MADALNYVVAKYIPDLLRQEPRNIGVFVFGQEGSAGRLVGEDAGGHLDLRHVPHELFNDGDVYAEWHAYWRKLLARFRDPMECREEIVESAQGTFAVWPGGELFPESPNTLQALCDDLYSRLVFALHPAMLAEESRTDGGETRSPELADEIANAFRAAQILATKPGQGEAFAPHPVRTNVPVEGTLPQPHLPRFVQDNGRRYVMEHVDFARSAKNGREHGGYAAYMLGDIQIAGEQSSRQVESIAVVNRLHPAAPLRKNETRIIEAQEYGLGALEKSNVRIVRWDDLVERQHFIRERVEVARRVGP